jgi:hypothetical protein
MVSLVHQKVSAVADGGDTTFVRPSDWNAEHTLSLSATDRLLGRSTAGAGAAEEITCTSFARSILDDANEAAFKATVNLEIGVDVQAYDADLTTWAGLTPSANAQSLVTAADYAAMRALLDLEVGTDFLSVAAIAAAYQPLDADLTSWAGVTRAAGFDTFAATPTSANLNTLVTDQTGSGALMFATSPVVTTDITIPNTGLHLLDTDSSHDLIIAPGSNLTIDRTLTITTGDADRTLDISAASVTISSYMAGLLDDANEATFKASVNLEIGVDVQAYDADLTTWAGVTPGTGVAAALAVAVGSAGAFVTFNGAGGTPSSLTLTNASGLPLSGVTDSTSEALGVGTLELGHASDTTLGRSAAGVLTVESVPVAMTGKQTIFIPAGAMIARTTNGAASGTTELATNDVMLKTADFDTTTEEGVGFWVGMPKSWNESTVTFEALWTAASGSGGVAFGLAAYAFSNDDAMDTAVSGQQIVTDTLITANDMHVTAESSAITIGGTPAEGDAVYFELTREVANGSDTLAVDAKLIGIRLFFSTSAGNDA